ncbi:MAG: MarR family winged helix-turn-helix transcriptional regulator [Christensenellales bacterium]|jgi:DNA-binding MarR family transcriptional regulator
MQRDPRQLNEFFVHVFNKILIFEEQALSRTGCPDLSVRELHVIEAVSDLARLGRNTMSAIAEMLAISVSSLTTAVNVLVRKAYLRREGSQQDRRMVYVCLTEKGAQAEAQHRAFHERMIASVSEQLTDAQWQTLLKSLDVLGRFFAGGDADAAH